MFDNSISPGNDVQETPVIPTGKIVTLKKFGGFDPRIGDYIDSIIALRWGSGGSWTTIRAGGQMFDLDLSIDFVGDGAKKFQIVRQNKSVVSKVIIAWVEALVHDL